MNVLIVKLNATGDVVRTTTLLRRLQGEVTWVTARTNVELLDGLPGVRCLSWEDRDAARDRSYDLMINLEDELETADFVAQVSYSKLFGAYLTADRPVGYTDDSRRWFDLSLIRVHGRQRADELKLQNRRTYEDLIFEGLGWQVTGEAYLLQSPTPTPLRDDVAIAPSPARLADEGVGALSAPRAIGS